MKGLKKLLSLGTIAAALMGLWLPGAAGLFIAGGCGGGSSGTPAANAGPDQAVLVDVLVTLDGSASTGVTSSAWTLTAPTGSAAALAEATTLAPTFTPDLEGAYVATLTINGDDTLTDSVTITASTAVATYSIPDGSAITTRTRYGVTEYVVNSEATGATLAASGEVAALTLKGGVATGFTWTQVAGPEATVVDGASATLNFTAPGLHEMMNQSDRFKWQILPVSRDDTRMVFKVAMTDADGNTGAATVSVYLQDDGAEIHTSSGLSNVPLGARVYLNGPEEQEEEELEITDWTWTLTTKPTGSSAAFVDTGTATSNLQVPSFVPDVPGVYVVSYSTSGVACAAYDLTTINCPGTITIAAGDYSGVGTIGGTTPHGAECATCHDGVDIAGLGDKTTEWAATLHATALADNMTDPWLEYHTVGYNLDANALGFDDLMAAAGLTALPATYDELLSTYPTVAKLANVQCENCHGPGSNHNGDPVYVADSFAQAGVCGQCHTEEDEWKNSAHNSAHSHEGGFVGAAGNRCSRCHGAKGFVTHLEEDTWIPGEAGLDDDFPYAGITCAACHDPHDATNTHQLRLAGNVTMVIDGSTVDAGKAAVCYACHDGFYTYGSTSCDSDRNGSSDTICTSLYQSATQGQRAPVHYAAAGPMLEGRGALTDLDEDGTADLTLDENSFHSGSSFTLAGVTGDSSLSATNDKCITCHMYEGPEANEDGYHQIGGHAFSMVAEDGTEHLEACTVCHGSKISEANGGFNRRARADYDGDGTIKGIEDEVKGLMLNLTTLLMTLDKVTDTKCKILSGGTTETGGVITVGSISVGSTSSASTCTDGAYQQNVKKRWWNLTCDVAGDPANCTDANDTWAEKTDEQKAKNKAALAAITNYQYIYGDHSLGIHNAAYAVQILQQTYAAVRIIFDGEAATWTYQNDFPNATLR